MNCVGAGGDALAPGAGERCAAAWRPLGEAATAGGPCYVLVRGDEAIVEALSDKKRAYLRTIRTIANRMRVGSALIRLWSITVVAALVALATNPAQGRFAWLALAMALGFWMLDAYFSRQERLFRKTYERVMSLPESEVDFDSGTAPVDSEELSFSSIFLSGALSAFYGIIVSLIIVIRLVIARGR